MYHIKNLNIEDSSEFYEDSSDLNLTVKLWNTTEFFKLLKFYEILVLPTEILNLVFHYFPLWIETREGLLDQYPHEKLIFTDLGVCNDPRHNI